MPSIPLYDSNAHPDGWHDVRAPGGYEWWYFDAADRATDTQIVVILMQGFIFHPGYLRAFDRFIKRPTKHLPPTAADFPCVYACVYRGGKIWKQFFTQFRREDFSAARDGVDVRIGENNWVRATPDGYDLYAIGWPWKLTARGPVMAADEAMSVKLSFTSKSRIQPIQRRFLSREMTGADHFWTIASPDCRVAGSVRIEKAGAKGEELLNFSGHGYHDHNYGTAPIRQGLQRWIWGRAMFGDRVLTFHHAEPNGKTSADLGATGRTRPVPDSTNTALTDGVPSVAPDQADAARSPRSPSPETHLVEVTEAGARDITVTRVEADWSLACKPAMMLRYPRFLRLGSELELSNPRVIDPSPFYLRLVFDAVSRGQSSQAFCEIAYPHRLTWPILGRMIEMSFNKRPALR